MTTRFRKAILFCLLGCGAAASAQNITGTSGQVVGRVIDSSGAVLPGVTLVASSPALPGTATTVTDGQGDYRFPALPFGQYRIAASLQGFGPKTLENLSLKIGETLRVNLQLAPGLSETVTVESAASVIDTASSTNDVSLNSEAIMELPRDRSFDSIITIIPSVNKDNLAGGNQDAGTTNGISVQGASISENVFVVDGVETSNTQNGVSAQDIVFEFTEEVQVKSGGFSAQFGGALGGLVNIVTRSGSNKWSGQATFQTTSDELTAGLRPTLTLTTDNLGFRYLPRNLDNFQSLDFGGTLGGPIKKDKLWFFAGYMPQRNDYDRPITYTQGGSDTYLREERKNYAIGKLTWRPKERVKVNASYSHSPYSEKGSLPPPGTLPFKPVYDYSLVNGFSNAKSATVSLDWTVNDSFLVNAFAGQYWLDGSEAVAKTTRITYSTSSLVFPQLPASLRAPAGFETAPNNLGDLNRQQRRPAFGLSGTKFFKARGEHTLNFGTQYASPRTNVDRDYSGGRFTVFWDQAFQGVRGTFGHYREIILTVNGIVDSSTLALFAQDAWRVSSRVTLNLGLRGENETVDTFTPKFPTTPTIKFGFGEKIAPRLGVAWDVRGNSHWKVFANYGWFYDTLKHSLPRVAFSGTEFSTNYYLLNDPDITKLTRATPSALGAQFNRVVSIVPSQNPLDPDIKPTRTEEIALGTEIALSDNLALSARYTHKGIKNMINWVRLAPGGVGAGVDTIVNPGRGLAEFPYGTGFPRMPELTRRYDGLEMSVTKRMSGGWTGSFSYTYSRLRGNFDGLANADDTGNALVPGTNFSCRFLEGCYTAGGQPDEGPLSLDRPHEAKAYAAWRTKFGLTLGGFASFRSGVPYEEQTSVILATGAQADLTHPFGRGSGGRAENLTQMDLFADWGIRLRDRVRASVFASLLNVFDQDTGIAIYSAKYRSSISVPRAQYLQGYDFDAVAAAQRVALDPQFRQPFRFQEPRKIRLGVRFTF